MSPRPSNFVETARVVLQTADPRVKAEISLSAVKRFGSGEVAALGEMDRSGWPDVPARPDRPILGDPRKMPRRGVGGVKGRIGLFHALAHIELNAIDLAWDVGGRFARAPELAGREAEFVGDWARIAAEEAKHFLLLSDYLNGQGAAYGDLPAHDGLWSASQSTAGDLCARLAIVPLVHEARGLDVTPALIKSLEDAGEKNAAEILGVIYADEVGHVRTGFKWFEIVCRVRELEPVEAFQKFVRQHHRGPLKRPFNEEARLLAGLTRSFYEPLTT